VDSAVRHILLKQGVLGIRVKIMLAHDPQGKIGPKKPLSDVVQIFEPKDVEAAGPVKAHAHNVQEAAGAAAAPAAAAAGAGAQRGAQQAASRAAEAATLEAAVKGFTVG